MRHAGVADGPQAGRPAAGTMALALASIYTTTKEKDSYGGSDGHVNPRTDSPTSLNFVPHGRLAPWIPLDPSVGSSDSNSTWMHVPSVIGLATGVVRHAHLLAS